MHSTRTYLLGSLLLASTLGCQSGVKELGFSHKMRTDYAISEAEFEGLEFYISTRVMVRALSEVPEIDPNGSGVIIAAKGTEGKVVGVGPDWLRVTFGLGDGAYFKTDISKDYDSYWLATEVEGTDGLFALKTRDDHVLLLEGISYHVVSGTAAYLQVDADSWERFVSTRTHAPGAE